MTIQPCYLIRVFGKCEAYFLFHFQAPLAHASPVKTRPQIYLHTIITDF